MIVICCYKIFRLDIRKFLNVERAIKLDNVYFNFTFKTYIEFYSHLSTYLTNKYVLHIIEDTI